ncbi:MAG: diadenylate cyclase, partial [Planctomycetes bacterium]|nr:diadenylate cyclase [Planctomycetota bacterium]
YTILNFIKGTKGHILLKGAVFFVAIVYLVILTVVNLAGLTRIQTLIESLLSVSVICSVIIFAPEIRRGLLQLAYSFPFQSVNLPIEERVVTEMVNGVYELAQNRSGALIAIERRVPLDEWLQTGEKMDSEISAKILVNIFYSGSPLHDGGIIIRRNKIAGSACTFPISESPASSMFYGMRHKAALGITEETDAICIVVSEEMGTVTLFGAGNYIQDIDRMSLVATLNELAGLSKNKAKGKLLNTTRRLIKGN